MDNEKIKFSVPDIFLNVKTLDISDKDSLRDVHFHDAIEIVTVDDGEIICDIENQHIVLKESEFMLINRRVIHKLSFYKQPAKLTYIQIDIDKYIPDNTYPVNNITMPKYMVFDAESEIALTYSDIIKELKSQQYGYMTYLKSDIARIIAIMTRNKLISNNSMFENKNNTKIMLAIKYINEHYRSKLYLDEVAKAVSIDKFYLCKLFRQNFDMTFTEYVNLLRLAKAEHCLLHSDKSVSEITYEYGFASTQYFNKLFKERNGCSPKEYRKLYKSIFSF